MEPADKAETRKADRPRERGHESEDDVTPPSPIQIATEAGMAGDFDLPDPQELRKIESDTQSRLKAILEVAGVTGLSQIDAQTFQDPEILRKLTNSVSSALDEAATALTRMKSERGYEGGYEAFLRGAHQPSPPSPPLTITPSPSPSSAPRAPCDGRSAAASQEVEGEGEEATGGMAGGWVQSQDVVEEGNTGVYVQEGPAANEVDRGEDYQGESIQTMHRLLTQGQNIQDASEDGESLLSLACSAGYYELAEVLLRMRASVEDRGVKGDSTPLMEAASGGYADIVRLLINHGANVHAKSSAGNTALTYACCGGFEDVVRILLDAGAEVEHQNENGHTPLMEAASCGHVGVAKLLLEYGANINTHSNEFKESALTLACYKGHLEMVKYLLNAGADQEHKTDEMHTALMEASMDGHVDVARLLLDHGAQVNMPVDSFESPLTLAACGGHYDLVALLISRGADLEEVNDEGYTPLMEASREGHEEVVTLLVEHGAHVNGQTEETQETALTLACCGGFLEVVQYLVEHGADIELGASTPLMEAAQEGHVDIVKYVLERSANVHAETSTQDTALTYASANGHTIIADILLQCGAHLEHECEGGRTPLMKAARAGHLQTVQFLASKGADVNRHTANNDHTVLSLACSGGHISTVQYLLSQGACPTHILRDNATMLTEASRGGHLSVANLLLRQPRLQQSSHHSSTRASKDYHHYERIKLAPGRKSHGRNPHHHYSTQGGSGAGKSQKPAAASSNEGGPANHQNHGQVSTATQPDNGHTKTQRKTQATSASEGEAVGRVVGGAVGGAVGGEAGRSGEEPGGSAKRQKISEEPNAGHNKKNHPTTSVPPRNIPRVGPTGSNPNDPSPSSTAEVTSATTTTVTTASSNHPQHLVSSAPANQLSAEDVLKRCMHQMAQTQSASPVPTTNTPSTAPSWPISNSSAGTTTITTTPTSSVTGSTGSQWDSKPGAKVVESPSSVFSRGNFASLDHLSPPLSSQPSSSSSSQPHPKFHARVKSTTAAPATSAAVTSSTTTSRPPHTHTTPSSSTTAFTNADISRLIPHLEAIASSLQNTPTLESHCLAALAQTHLLPVLAQYDPDSPQAAEVLDALQALPLVAGDGKQIPLSNSAAVDSASFLASLDMNALMQTLASPELQGADPSSDVHSQPVYPAEFSSLKRLSQKMQVTAGVQASTDQSGGGGSGHQLEQDHLPSRSRPLTTSFLLDHNFPMDIPPPTDLLPEHLPLPSGYVRTVENESYLSSEEDDLEEEGSDTSYLAQEIALPPGSYDPAIEIDQQTDSNHDTALTLAAAGGHDELVELLISHAANIEHRDKKGCTPLILAASAGHAVTVAILLDHSADIEAQSDRTKDTALSLACSGGRQEVVEILLAKGANFEHRNVSDYTPLSLAASGGYVNIIKMLLRAGADINSRTGSKLGITPLMLAAMNGHTSTVKLLLDMGSDINAQIETNRNTALTLACFQGRHEVVSLLVERQANVEHRAKTGLTPLMEAASGGYHEVGKVLINKGADVNAAPVPSSRDTGLTIAADKGHYRFVDLILRESAHVDVKNKKGNSPLWLAANGGHLDVVRLLVDHGSDLDSQDNRKVSCLMAAFRKGHFKVVKFLVDHVSQFPSDAELTRYISTLSDKEILKKCQRCMEVIIDAKERQAAEANKNATILLQEIDQEKKHEEDRKAAAARKRAKKKRQKEKKQALKAQKGDKVGEKGSSGGGCMGGDSPPEGDHVDDPADDVMAENGETPDDLSPVDRIPPKDPLPLPITKKQSPSEREKVLGGGGRVSSRLGRLPSTSSIAGVTLSPGGAVSPGMTTPTSSPRKGKKEDGWKEVGKRTKRVSIPGSVFAAVVGKNSCNLLLIRQATNTHIEIERTSKTASTRTLSIRGSTEAIKQAQHFISQLVKDPAHNIASILPKSAHLHVPHSVSSSHTHMYSHKSHSISHDPTSTTPHSALFDDHRVLPSSASISMTTTTSSTTTVSMQNVHAAMGMRTALKRATSTSGGPSATLSHASTVNSFPLTNTKTGKAVIEKRHSAPHSVLAAADLRHIANSVMATSQAKVVGVVTNATTGKLTTPMTPTGGAVRRLFSTTAVHSVPMQTVSVVSAPQTTLPILSPTQSVVSQPSKIAAGMVPPPARVPPVTTIVVSQHMAPLGKSLQSYPTSMAATNMTKVVPSHSDYYDIKPDVLPTTIPGTNLSYSRVIGSHLTSSLIEQPLQQIMKTPTIFQEPATQITKPKKYSDAVGKKLNESMGHSTAKTAVPGNPLVTAPPPLPPPSFAHPPLSLASTHTSSLPSSITSALPPSLPLPPSMTSSVLNLAPGTRPTVPDDKATQVAAYPQQMSIKPNLWLDHDTAIPDHRQAFDEDDRLPQPPNLGPIGPPSKFSKPPQGGVSKPIPPGTRGDIGAPGRVEGGRFSPIGSRGTRTSPNSGTTASPQRSSDPSPVAKSPLLGPAPPGGLLPTPEKLYTSVGFRPIQSQSSQEFPPSSSDRGREPDGLPLTPTPVRNPRPPLLATPPGFPPPFLSQSIHQSPIHPKPGQKPASPVQPLNISPDKVSPNKSPPQLPPSSKGFNPNAPTFVPMGLQGVQRPSNPPPTSSILGAPPISKLTNFPPPVGSSILGNAPPIGGGPRMVGPNIHPAQPPQPPPPPPSGGQTSILGQPPTPSINPHIFNPPPMPPGPGQQNFPPKPPGQPMFGQFDGNQPSPGVLQPPMAPFGIVFPGTPPAQQTFVGQPNQNFGGGTKDFLPGSLEGGFLPNPMSQQPMMNQGPPPPVGASEMSRFGVPLMNIGKTEPDTPDAVLGVTGGTQNIPLPPMLMTSDANTFDSAPLHPQMARGNMFCMGLQQSQPGLRPLPQDTPTPTSSTSILGNFSTSNLDIFPTFHPMSQRITASTGDNTTAMPHSTLMMVSQSVFSAAPATSDGAGSSHDTAGTGGDSLLPIGTERAHKGSSLGGGGGGGSGGAAPTNSAPGNSSSFPMLAPGINPSSVWSYSGNTNTHEDSDWSHQVGGTVDSDPHSWPASVKPSQSRCTHDIVITSQDTLQSVLANVGLTEHMELFQSNEIDLEALLLMSEKDFSEIGLPQAAQITLLNTIGRRSSREEVTSVGEGSTSLDQGEGRGFPGSRQQQETL